MPRAPRRPCRRSVAGCAATTSNRTGLCDDCLKTERKLEDHRRGSAHSRGYGRRWQRVSRRFLRQHPLCKCDDCRSEGRETPSEVVDHIIPHRGDPVLFWDQTNWQAMAKVCHDRKTAREDGGFGRGG